MLIECVECGGIVSSEAKACPHCGMPVKKQNMPSVCPEKIDRAKEHVSVCGIVAYSVFRRILKVLLWMLLAGLIGTAGKFLTEVAIECGLFGWVMLVAFYPAIITIPTLALAKNLVGRVFANVLAVLCAVRCVASAAFLSTQVMSRNNSGIGEVIVGSVGLLIAVIWSAYFLKDSEDRPIPRWALVTKRVIFIINGFIAVAFILTLVL